MWTDLCWTGCFETAQRSWRATWICSTLGRTYSDFLSDPLGQDPTYLFVALSLGLVAATIEPEHVKHNRVILCDRSMRRLPNMRGKEFPVEKGAAMAGSNDEIKEPAAMGEPDVKKPYTTPELIVHGAVEKITEENKGSGQTDGTGINPTATFQIVRKDVLLLSPTALSSSAQFHYRISWRATGLQMW